MKNITWSLKYINHTQNAPKYHLHYTVQLKFQSCLVTRQKNLLRFGIRWKAYKKTAVDTWRSVQYNEQLKQERCYQSST